MSSLNVDTTIQMGKAVVSDSVCAKHDRFDLISPHLIDNSDVYVVDQISGALFHKVDTVAAASRSVAAFENLADALMLASQNMQSNVILIVNIDIAGDLDSIVEQLLAARVELPEMPVIICSETFSTNDFTAQRRAIADSSLRLPSSDTWVALAIESGISNNQTQPY
ncbi:MAG: hypothetical protein IKD58_03820 [Loktanella sp.]|nr:hypothetical protein [Loktanella sp.]